MLLWEVMSCIFIHQEGHPCTRQDPEQIGTQSLVEAGDALLDPNLDNGMQGSAVDEMGVIGLQSRSQHLIRIRHAPSKGFGNAREDKVVEVAELFFSSKIVFQSFVGHELKSAVTDSKQGRN